MLECLFCIAISPLFNTYGGDTISEFGAHVALGDPVYLWASYEEPEHKDVGQRMGKLRTPGAGLGYRVEAGRWRFGLEFGYFWPETSSDLEGKDANIRDEVVDQVLANLHGGGVSPFHAENFIYRVDEGWGGRISAGYAISEHFELFAALRPLKLTKFYSMCTGEDETCNYPVAQGERHWVSTLNHSMTSVQLGATVRF